MVNKTFKVPPGALEQAKKEIEEEKFREAVEAEKEKLRHKRSFWEVVFPWTITVTKKGH